ncbi:23S rRNA (adenine(2503)-C(2))-methyltransferase RlmN [bacterium]|nr:23S rRNA (adenine(2503)-C(2))-methyltransferase RlmN [bacterium]
MANQKINLIGMSQSQTHSLLGDLGVPEKQQAQRQRELWNWIYVRGVSDFALMEGIGKPLQRQLENRCTLALPKIITEQVSVDGTRKWLLEVADPDGGSPHEIETVYIPESDRGTVCVSSQVGCSLNCTFCHTGTMRMMKNLTPYEILAQILLVRDRLNDYPDQRRDMFADPRPRLMNVSGKALAAGSSRDLPAASALPLSKKYSSESKLNQQTRPNIIAPSTGRKVSNVVMMGMGEPLLNFENVKQALLIALDDDGLGLSRRRITLSTSGVVPGIARTGDELNIALAISLHAVNDELRDELVPINRKYPLQKLLKACQNYRGLSNARRITFEYVMLDGVNDSIDDAQTLVQLLRPIPAKINLIPFNPWPGSRYRCSTENALHQFAEHLRDNGYPSPIRATRGQDIMAACGQLKSENNLVVAIGSNEQTK